MAELGIVAEKGRDGGAKLVEVVAAARSTGTLPAEMITALSAIVDQIFSLQEQIDELTAAALAADTYHSDTVQRKLQPLYRQLHGTAPADGRV